MKKFDWKVVKDYAEVALGFVVYGLMLTATQKIADYVTEDYIGKVGYNEAVNAIMKSSMYSHDKCEATGALKRHEDAEFYKAIIHIAKDSRLYSHDKVDLIKGLCEK